MDSHCVVCGNYVPEGRTVCPQCEKGEKMDKWTLQEEAFKRGYEKGKADAVVHRQRLYNAHEVAVIIADLFGDTCACNFKSIDEWLPFKCELQAACPHPVGVACWEQYLKYRDAKMDGDGNG